MTFDLYDFFLSVLGGVLIGASAGGFYFFNGKIAGISGMLSSLFPPRGKDTDQKILFLIGLSVGAGLCALFTGRPTIDVAASSGLLIVAGGLVGFGARLSNGCTSGHGICGIARLSPNSLIATATFMAAGFATLAIRHLL
jgi:hypothetical protein